MQRRADTAPALSADKGGAVEQRAIHAKLSGGLDPEVSCQRVRWCSCTVRFNVSMERSENNDARTENPKPQNPRTFNITTRALHRNGALCRERFRPKVRGS